MSLVAAGIAKRYGTQTALDGVALELAEASYAVLLGPSGSGKTTLLSILGGFVAPDAGTVTLGAIDITGVPPARRPTATVFQDYALFPHMTVAGNIGFGLRMRRVGRPELTRRVDEVLALVGLDGFGGRRIDQLSGGQKQRVALARALVIRPQVLLLDEPLGALDLNLRGRMQEELVALQRRTGAIFVHVTHDQEEALSLADHLVVMRDGRIEDQGAPRRLYERPRTRFTATFLGESNVIEGQASAGSVTTALGRLPTTAADGPVDVLLRPEHLRLDAAGRDALAIDAVPRSVVFQGSVLRCHLGVPTIPGLDLVAALPVEVEPVVGAMVRLCVPHERIVVLPRA